MHQRLVQLHTTMGIHAPGTRPMNADSSPHHHKARVDVLASLSSKPPRKRRIRTRPTAAALIVLPLAIGFVWWIVGHDVAHDALRNESTVAATAATAVTAQPAADAKPPRAPDDSAITIRADATTPQSPPASAAPSIHIAAQPQTQLRARLESWRQAWVNRDVDAYLAHYSPAFKGTNGQPRSAWANARRRVISTRSEIEINLSAIEMQAVTADRWELRFLQDYASGGYVEKNLPKTLVLVRENGAWNIVAEQRTQAPIPATNAAR